MRRQIACGRRQIERVSRVGKNDIAVCECCQIDTGNSRAEINRCPLNGDVRTGQQLTADCRRAGDIGRAMTGDICGFERGGIAKKIASRQKRANINRSSLCYKRCVSGVANDDGSVGRSLAGSKIDTRDNRTSLDVRTRDADISAPKKLTRDMRVASNRNDAVTGHVLGCKRCSRNIQVSG